MKKVWHPYHVWEDFQDGMWRTVSGDEKQNYLKASIAFTSNHKLYGEWMMRVVRAWPLSCEHNLTDKSSNRRAWVGHAAASLAIGCPEDVTRQAWGFLTEEEQDLANGVADVAIEAWEKSYAR